MALDGAATRPPISDAPPAPRKPGYARFAIVLAAFGLALILVARPGIRSKLIKLLPFGTHMQMDTSVVVWANKQSGTYQCPGSAMYAKGAGNYMHQGDALTAGYQPALRGYCDPTEGIYSKGVTPVNSSPGR